MKHIISKYNLKPLLIIFFGLITDQITKIWAFATYSLPNGLPDYQKTTQIIDDFVVFRLIFNPGALFGSRPEKLIPFLHPTIFYLIIFAIAITTIVYLYVKTPLEQRGFRFSLIFILTGALGNLIDRIRIHKVIDFIDVDIPNINLPFLNYSLERWPVFNVADCFVSIGIGLYIITQILEYRNNKKNV